VRFAVWRGGGGGGGKVQWFKCTYCMKHESAELCFIFRSAHSAIFSPENIVSELLHHIHCNKPVKVPLTLVHYGKYSPRAILASRSRPCAIFPIAVL